MKSCSNPKCKIINPQSLDNFAKNKCKLDGLNNWCKNCIKNYRETHLQERKLYNLKNKNYIAQQKKKYYRENYEVALERKRKYRVNNKEKIREYRQNNKGKINALTRKRQATKLNATPKWLNIEQIKEMEENYVLAKELSWLSEEPLVVDHIIPLQGKEVSGLHVPWNLQILLNGDNIKKGNKI